MELIEHGMAGLSWKIYKVGFMIFQGRVIRYLDNLGRD